MLDGCYFMLGQNNWKFELDNSWGEDSNLPTRPNNAHALVFVDGTLLLATDNPHNNIIEYNKDGKVIDGWGKQWPGLHGLKATTHGYDRALFLVDSGWVVNRRWDGKSTNKWDSPFNKMIPQAGSVTKTSRTGQVIFSVGHPVTYGAYAPDAPFNPTDIVELENGDFYVIDGYGSDYILHYNQYGQFLNKFGQDGEHRISNGHGICLDTRGFEPSLLVSSRATHSLKWFTLDGAYIKSLHVPGAFIHAPIFIENHMIAPVCWTGEQDKPQDNTGVICVFNENNQLVSVLGGELPQKGERVRGDNSVFKHCHGLEKDDDGNLYLAQWNAGGVHPQRLLRR